MSAGPVIVWHEGFPSQLELVTRSGSLWKDVPKEGIFLRTDHAVTVFPDRKAAKAAIDRSVEYHGARPDRIIPNPNCLANRELYHIARLIPAQ